jgi:hypothetical protein
MDFLQGNRKTFAETPETGHCGAFSSEKSLHREKILKYIDL